MENVKKRVADALERVGIIFPLNEESMDSILFITGIVELEQEFNIEIPDQYLILEFFTSIENIADTIINLIE